MTTQHHRMRLTGARVAPRVGFVIAMLAWLLSACSTGAPILANPTAPRPSVVTPTRTPVAIADPVKVVLPRDDGPHDRLTEWWYYTGHLRATNGSHYGFEYVIFRAERGRFPVSWVSHLALTDETGQRFVYSPPWWIAARIM